MIACINGEFIGDDEARVSILDRSFLYGDGLFETLRVHSGRPFRWAQHMERLRRGADILAIPLPFTSEKLQAQSIELIRRADMPNALLRITLSRGVGKRGYSPQGADQPLLAMSLHPVPAVRQVGLAHWRLATCSYRVSPQDRLAALKTCNKLHAILARAEAEQRGADEALLLNTEGVIAECSSANVFWIERGRVLTPPLSSGALAGVTRGVVQELCPKLGLRYEEGDCPPGTLLSAEGVFVTLSSLGLVEIVALDERPLARSTCTLGLSESYQELLTRESEMT
jgi:aminodeoxychorismate lyase